MSIRRTRRRKQIGSRCKTNMATYQSVTDLEHYLSPEDAMVIRKEYITHKSYGDHVQHFKVLQDRCCQYYVWDELFSSLNELVEFYHSNSIAKERTVFLRDPEHFARRPHHAHALFDFTPHHPSQLRFLRGDVIELIDCSDSLRWRGRCHGHVGYFPPEYVQPIYHCQ